MRLDRYAGVHRKSCQADGPYVEVGTRVPWYSQLVMNAGAHTGAAVTPYEASGRVRFEYEARAGLCAGYRGMYMVVVGHESW